MSTTTTTTTAQAAIAAFLADATPEEREDARRDVNALIAKTIGPNTTIHPSNVREGDIVFLDGKQVGEVTMIAVLDDDDRTTLVQYGNRGTFGRTGPLLQPLVGDVPNILIKKEFNLEPRHAAVRVYRAS